MRNVFSLIDAFSSPLVVQAKVEIRLKVAMGMVKEAITRRLATRRR
jgi:hypothetical protein